MYFEAAVRKLPLEWSHSVYQWSLWLIIKLYWHCNHDYSVLSSSAAVNCFQWKMWILKEKWQQLDRCLALSFSPSRRLASHSQHTGHQARDTEVLRRGFCDCGTQIRRSQVIQANYSPVTSCGHWNGRMDWMLWNPWRFSNQLCLEKSRKASQRRGYLSWVLKCKNEKKNFLQEKEEWQEGRNNKLKRHMDLWKSRIYFLNNENST